MEDLLKQESHFAFGKNWLDYAKKIDEVKIAQAMADLQRLNGGQRFDGKSFLDIGCGSGLHALAAIRLGAISVSCVDIDPDSVQATKGTLAKFAPDVPANVNVRSVFDMSPENDGTFDIVYSWGVLHHTGDMYRAIENASTLVKSKGTFIIALYRKTAFCGIWTVIKKWYSKAPPESQLRARSVRIFLHRLSHFIRGNNFEAYVKDYGVARGMDYHNDIHDWMGGYPYESITPEECELFFKKLKFELAYSMVRRISGILGSGCDEFKFVKTV